MSRAFRTNLIAIKKSMRLHYISNIAIHFYTDFCLGTGVPRHSAGGIATFVRMYVVHIVRSAHARVMEAENSSTLTIYL